MWDKNAFRCFYWTALMLSPTVPEVRKLCRICRRSIGIDLGEIVVLGPKRPAHGSDRRLGAAVVTHDAQVRKY